MLFRIRWCLFLFSSLTFSGREYCLQIREYTVLRFWFRVSLRLTYASILFFQIRVTTVFGHSGSECTGLAGISSGSGPSLSIDLLISDPFLYVSPYAWQSLWLWWCIDLIGYEIHHARFLWGCQYPLFSYGSCRLAAFSSFTSTSTVYPFL